MNEKFERVHFDGDEGINPKLYKRTYIAAGKTQSRFSILFTDWQSVRRKVAAGKDFERAIQKVYDLDKKNHAEVDFDEQKERTASLWRGGNSAAVRALFMLARWSSLEAHKKN